MRGRIIVSIKQQKDIRKFLVSEFEPQREEELYEKQNALLLEMVRDLQEQDKYVVMRKYMLDVVAAGKHTETAVTSTFMRN